MTSQAPESGRSEIALIRDQIKLLDIAQGFFQSQILFALQKMRVFELLDGTEKTVTDLAASTSARPDYLRRLLVAGRMLRLLEWRGDDRYALTPLSQALLAPSMGENFLGNWVRWLEYLSVPFDRLADTVLNGKPAEALGHLGGDAGDTREFTLAMHNYATLRGRELARVLDTRGYRSLLDLGCGPGTYAFNLGLRNPELTLHLLDLPPILEVAKEVRQRYTLTNEVHFLPLDVSAGEIPGRYDLVLVSNILQMLGERASRELIAKVYRCTGPGGSLVIQGQYMPDPETVVPERWPVIVDLLQLCMTPEGRNHTMAETAEWIESAGFTDVEQRPMSLLNANSYVQGYKR